MFSSAFLQHAGRGSLRHEEQLLKAEFEMLGVPVTFYTIKSIHRRNLPLSARTFIAGDMDAMHGAMAQLEIEVPSPKDYPLCLREFLHRRVWRENLGNLERAITSDMRAPVFAKPADRMKTFTGRVFASGVDFAEIGRLSRRQEVWCSEVVEWRSEYRVYVIDEEIVATDHYAGDQKTVLDDTVVEAAVRTYRRSGDAPSAYGIDFGVLASGQTALVEANDGYALGAYAIAGGQYAKLLMRRWSELLGQSKTCRPGDA